MNFLPFQSLAPSLQWPTSTYGFRQVANGFKDQWHAPTCLGAVITKRVHVKCPPAASAFSWMYEGRCLDESYFILLNIVDSQYKFNFIGTGYPGTVAHENQILHIIEKRFEQCPLPKTTQLPCGNRELSFVGCSVFEPAPWLTVASGAHDEQERREIARALRPAEVAHEVIFSRFGILSSKMHVPSPVYGTKVTRTICCLHNYFLDTSPKYAAEFIQREKRMESLSLEEEEKEKQPEGVLNYAVPNYLLDEDQPWLDKLHMGRELFRELLDLVIPRVQNVTVHIGHERRLRMALRFLCTGEGYDECLEKLLMVTLFGLSIALEEYEVQVSRGVVSSAFLSQLLMASFSPQMPLSKREWLAIAREFETKWQLPNCAGVFLTNSITMPNKKQWLEGVNVETPCSMALLADAKGRIIFGGEPQLQVLEFELGVASRPKVSDPVALALKEIDFNLPAVAGGEGKGKEEKTSLSFIGTQRMRPHALLATPGRGRQFNRDEVKRGNQLASRVAKVLHERFLVTQQVMGTSNSRAFGTMFAIRKMHNFLLEKSETYGVAFQE